MLTGLGAASGTQQPPARPPQMTEKVDVSRVVVDVHVLADDGSPILGLRASDFRVLIDGRPAVIDQVRWASDSIATQVTQAESSATNRLDHAPVGLPAGRQIIMLVQRDLEPSRFQGLVTLLRRAVGFVDGLHRDDRVAVVSFQSHLDLWTDYTTDHAVLRALMERRLLTQAPPADVAQGEGPSLSLAFDRSAGRRASSMEQALVVLARALDSLPGEKWVVVFGFGFGRMLSGMVAVDAEYGEASQLLMKARAKVFCLDVTDAASHTLEAGLQQVAADTGGFYARTNEWPGLAMDRLGLALSGRYEVALVKPDLPRGEHAITIQLVGRTARVLARRAYRD